jgi:HD-GYP domain-containing protein (c-di-GMP phosphodiesterase class II)
MNSQSRRLKKLLPHGLLREALLVLSCLVVAGMLNYAVITDTAFLNFYNMTVVVAAFFLGRRVAVMSAVLSILIVVLLAVARSDFLGGDTRNLLIRIAALAAWGSFLVLTAYLTGSLCEKQEQTKRELRDTYQGILQLGVRMGFTEQQLEDMRAAALIHDVGKLKISRSVLYKASRLTDGEYAELKSHLTQGFEILRPVSGQLRRVVDIVLAHHEKYDGSGYYGAAGDAIPVEARVLACVDVYDALVSDRPYRKALDPYRAKETILSASGKHFDPSVAKAFESSFEAGEMEIPESLNPILGDEVMRAMETAGQEQ